jgi:hypothetical protein
MLPNDVLRTVPLLQIVGLDPTQGIPQHLATVYKILPPYYRLEDMKGILTYLMGPETFCMLCHLTYPIHTSLLATVPAALHVQMLSHFPTLGLEDRATNVEALIKTPTASRGNDVLTTTQPWQRPNSVTAPTPTSQELTLVTRRLDQLQVTTTAITDLRAEQTRTASQLAALQQSHEEAIAKIQELTQTQDQLTLQTDTKLRRMDNDLDQVRQTVADAIALLQTIAPRTRSESPAPIRPRLGSSRDV